MRDIRFRAWVSDNGDPPQMIYYEKMELDNGMWFRNPDAIHTSDIHEIMQFVGLRDNNGKEIYELDIVRLIEPNRIYTVEWTEYTFKLIHADPKLDRMHWGSIQRVAELHWGIEVIGNLYEHPHLLNQEK